MQIIAFEIEPVVAAVRTIRPGNSRSAANPATEGVVLRLATDDRRRFWLRLGNGSSHGVDPRRTLMAELEHLRPIVVGAQASAMRETPS